MKKSSHGHLKSGLTTAFTNINTFSSLAGFFIVLIIAVVDILLVIPLLKAAGFPVIVAQQGPIISGVLGGLGSFTTWYHYARLGLRREQLEARGEAKSLATDQVTSLISKAPQAMPGGWGCRSGLSLVIIGISLILAVLGPKAVAQGQAVTKAHVPSHPTPPSAPTFITGILPTSTPRATATPLPTATMTPVPTHVPTATSTLTPTPTSVPSAHLIAPITQKGPLNCGNASVPFTLTNTGGREAVFSYFWNGFDPGSFTLTPSNTHVLGGDSQTLTFSGAYAVLSPMPLVVGVDWSDFNNGTYTYGGRIFLTLLCNPVIIG